MLGAIVDLIMGMTVSAVLGIDNPARDIGPDVRPVSLAGQRCGAFFLTVTRTRRSGTIVYTPGAGFIGRDALHVVRDSWAKIDGPIILTSSAGAQRQQRRCELAQ
jgi:hypothetical protein